MATLRTVREFVRLDAEWSRAGIRAWDACLMNGVSPQGAADAMKRLARAGLAEVLPRERHWKAVRYRLVREHPLAIALDDLFAAERATVAPAERARRRETMLRLRAERRAREQAAWEARIRAEREGSPPDG